MIIWVAGAAFSFVLGLLLIWYGEKRHYSSYGRRYYLQFVTLCGWVFLMWSVVIALGLWVAYS